MASCRMSINDFFFFARHQLKAANLLNSVVCPLEGLEQLRLQAIANEICSRPHITDPQPQHATISAATFCNAAFHKLDRRLKKGSESDRTSVHPLFSWRRRRKSLTINFIHDRRENNKVHRCNHDPLRENFLVEKVKPCQISTKKKRKSEAKNWISSRNLHLQVQFFLLPRRFRLINSY